MQKNPAAANKYVNDPRFMQVLGVLLGVNISTAEPGQAQPPPPPQQQRQPEPEPVPEVEMSGA